MDGSSHVQAAITTADLDPLTPIMTEHGGAFRSVPDRARRPRRIQTVTAQVSPADDDDLLRASAQGLFTDLMHQFGITGHL